MFHIYGRQPSPITYPLLSDRETQTVRFECAKCDSLLTSKMYLYQHEATVHNRIFHCPFCSALFSNKHDYKIHVTAHSEKRFLPCAFCKKAFNEVADYVEHLKLHREPFLYPCEKCPAMFAQLSGLRVHTATHLRKKFIHTIQNVSHTFGRPLRKLSRKRFKRYSSKKNKFTATDGSSLTTAAANAAVEPSISDPPVTFEPIIFTSTVSTNTEPSINDESSSVVNTNESLCGSENRKKSSKCSRISKKTQRKIPVASSSTAISSNVDVVNHSSSNGAKISRKCGRLSKKKPENLRNTRSSRLTTTSEVTVTSVANPLPSIYDGKESSSNCNAGGKCDSAMQTVCTTSSDDVPSVITAQTNDVAPNPDRCEENFTTINDASPDEADFIVKVKYNLRRSTLMLRRCRRSSASITYRRTSKRKRAYDFFLCSFCSRVFRNFFALYKHKMLHEINKGSRCDECGGLFGGNGNVVLHKKSAHSISSDTNTLI